MISSYVLQRLLITLVIFLTTIGAVGAAQWYIQSLHAELLAQQQAIINYKQQQSQLATTLQAAEQAAADLLILRPTALGTDDVVTFISDLESNLRQLGVTVETESIKNNTNVTPRLITFTMTLKGSEAAVERALKQKFLAQYAHRVEEAKVTFSGDAVQYRFTFSVLQFMYDF